MLNICKKHIFVLPLVTALVLVSLTVAAHADKQLKVKIDHNVEVTMRDGTILRANVFQPNKGGPYPALVMRTPYGKKGSGFDTLVKAGYIVVSQDVRGRYASDGQWESFMRFDTHDAEDGYDTVEWAAKLPNCNGKVGTFGRSYHAFVQWRLAPLRPPSLGAMAACSIPARYTDLEGPGTIRPGRRLYWWAVTMAPDMRANAGCSQCGDKFIGELWCKNNGDENLLQKVSHNWNWFLPWLDLPRQVFEHETKFVKDWLRNPHTDPWKLHEDVRKISVPNLNITGWFDHCNGDMLLDRTMMKKAKTEMARTGSRTLIGPWNHSKLGEQHFGRKDVINFGKKANIDLDRLYIRWFDYWLKGKKNGMGQTAPYRIFVMGDNQWDDEEEWPPARAKDKIVYLTSSGHANSNSTKSNGMDGKIIFRRPKIARSDRYVYDPVNPVASLHGTQPGPTDRRRLPKRQDILVYRTAPLTERIEVTGNPEVELFASSSARDTDFFVRLVDVGPKGLARDVSQGMVRARYRKSLKKPSLIKPNKVIRYTIRMSPTSNAFLPGHRIRLEITSSDFPSYDRNHNTAADQNADATLTKATQKIYHGGMRATRIHLPWIKND